jgi:hypothetical protein
MNTPAQLDKSPDHNRRDISASQHSHQDSQPPSLVRLGPYLQAALKIPGMIFGALLLGY